MPTYTVHDEKKSETYDVVMSWDALQEHLKNNPHIKKLLSAPAIIGGHGDRAKGDTGFKEVMSKIGEAHPGSEVAKKYGDNRTIKQKKTIDTVTKHVVKQAKRK